MLEIPPIDIVKENQCYQVLSDLPISLYTLPCWLKLHGSKRKKGFTPHFSLDW